MTYQSKPFGESAIGSDSKLFVRARIRFTLLSLVVALAVAGAFSAYVYLNVTSDVTDIGSQVTKSGGIPADTDNVQQQDNVQQFVSGTTSSVLNSLAYADIALLLCVTVASYYASGLLLRPIERANRAQRAFATNASHELRTPLAIMRSDIERLARGAYKRPEDAREVALSNLEELSRMERIIGTLLALVRLEGGMGKPRPLHLDSLVREELEPFAKLAREQDLELSYEGDSELMIRAVPDIGSAVRNLVQNSFAHTSKGGTVQVTARPQGSYALIEIQDTGAGIAPDALPRVFEPFYKGEKSAGSGLGLALVKELVERSGGSVGIESVLGSGTRVEVRLPLA